MRRVWRCDHCIKTTIKENKMVIHEKKCVFNVKNKLCYSCATMIMDV